MKNSTRPAVLSALVAASEPLCAMTHAEWMEQVYSELEAAGMDRSDAQGIAVGRCCRA